MEERQRASQHCHPENRISSSNEGITISDSRKRGRSSCSSCGSISSRGLSLVLSLVLVTCVRSFRFLRVSKGGGGFFGGAKGDRRQGEGGSHKNYVGISGNQWWKRPPLGEEGGRGLSTHLIPTRYRLETDELLPITISTSSSSAAASSLFIHPRFIPSSSSSSSLLSSSTSASAVDDSPFVYGSGSSNGFVSMDTSSDLGQLVLMDEEGVMKPSLLLTRGEGGQEEALPLNLPSIMEPGPSAPRKPGFQQNNNFTLNLGKALDALRVDVPLCFEREPDMSIYTEDIRFRDDSRVYSNGKFMYQMFYFSLRLARVFMPMPPIVEVLNIRWCSIRQCIYVRFQIRIDALNDQLYFDATSVYRVNAQGMIYEHLIENVIRNDLMEKPSILSLYYTTKQILTAPGSPPPVPDSI